MKKHAYKFVTHPLVSGSGIIFAGSFVANVLNFLFNLLMGRWLSVSEYGLLTALISLTVLVGMLNGSLSRIFTKFAASYYAKKQTTKIRELYQGGLKLTFIFSLAVMFVLLLATPLLIEFMKVSSPVLLILTYAFIFFSALTALPYGILHGEMKFLKISFLTTLAPLIKIVIAILAILLGFGLFGVVTGILITSIVMFLAMSIMVEKGDRVGSSGKGNSQVLSEIKKYGLPFSIAWLGVNFISNADIILVRHFFDPFVSGQYAALSLMGKAIFYFTTPIYLVLFPLVAYKKSKNERVYETVFLAALIIGSLSILLSFVYFLFPHIVLKIFFPNPDYQSLAPFLGPFSLYIIVFSGVYLLNNYLLSAGKTGVYKLNIAAVVSMVVLFVFLHDSLYQIIGILFLVSFILLVSQIIYYRFSR